MFEGLKKKFSDFVGSIVKKEEVKAGQEEQTEPQKELASHKEIDLPKHEEIDLPKHQEKDLPAPKPQSPRLEPTLVSTEADVEKKLEEKIPPQQIEQMPITHTVAAPTHPKPIESKPKITSQKPPEAPIQRKGILSDAPKFSVLTKIKSAIIGKVTIKEQDVEELLENFKLSLVESDVNYGVAEEIVDVIRSRIIGASVQTSQIKPYISSTVRDSLFAILNKGEGKDLLALASQKKQSGETPFKVLFIGPNGAGKTTTMAKIANMLLTNNLSCVLSASDTFRAAAIEQTVYHAEKLGIKAIKGTYGADPASVGFDAIEYAKAHRIDVVLIDSAGRQDTNKSLMEEMRKMARITKPDLKVFIGESTTGGAIIDQVREFNNAIGLDGIILTKLDCDAKGGNTISILGSSPVPILYFGLGEKYSDIMPYSAEFIVGNILPSAT